VLSGHRHGPLFRCSDVLGTSNRPAFEVPDGLDPLLTLALGMRAGFSRKPALPVGAAVEKIERFPTPLVSYGLSAGRSSYRELDGLTTAWDVTRVGLVPIGKFRPTARPIAVVGSTAEDLALAIALDRMYGPSAWVPTEWASGDQQWLVQRAFNDLIDRAGTMGHPPTITSISMSAADLQNLIDTRWPKPVEWQDTQGIGGTFGGERPEIVAPDRLDLQSPLHLACGPGDYDLAVTLPAQADGLGGFTFEFAMPVQTPSSEDLRGPARPFWEVDVEVDRSAMPSGRDLNGRSLLADLEPLTATVLRSGRDGITFNPASMFFVPGGATLAQSIAKPRLRVLGLRGWVAAITAQHHPDMSVELSEAGRRALILTRMWGSRSAVAEDLFALGPFLAEFRASSKTYTTAYPAGDGYPLQRNEGVLTLNAANRTLASSLGPESVRDRVNHLLQIKVLQRGLVMSCSECERWAFYRMDLLKERNTCARCGAPAYSTKSRWATPHGEPEWYYDLHGAVRELLAQNGDVPLLAARTLAESARSYEDVAELDFLTPAGTRSEIDLIALVDGRLIVGEAKRNAEVGTDKVRKTAEKLIRVADVLGADEILLCSTATGPWKTSEVEMLLSAITRQEWRYGSEPKLRIITDLRGGKPQNSLVEQQ